MNTHGRTLVEQDELDAVVGAKKDLELSRKQALLLVEQLRDEGRDLAADMVEDLDRAVGRLQRDLDEVRADLADARGGVKTSRGKDRASGAGTIAGAGKGGPLGIAPPHKHDYAADGKCTRMFNGKFCTASRQRQSKKSRQTSIPGTDGGAKAAEGTA